MTTSIAERARELTGQRRPFVHATVVRAQAPTSARPGDDAVILDDGSIEGFVGGVCAESSVRAAALDTLRDGSTLLLRVLPDGSAEFPEAPGALVVVNPCLSGGAVEIFLRPDPLTIARGLSSRLHSRLVTGQDIGQTYSFVQTGNAELGFVAWSQLRRPGGKIPGSYWLVPEALHRPIEQEAVLLRDGVAARAFLEFSKTPGAREIVRSYGYGP